MFILERWQAFIRTMKNWKIVNNTILGLLIVLCLIGTFYKHISWGWGLGDIFAYGFLYLITAVHLVITLIKNTNDATTYRTLSIVFCLLTVFFCLKATIWRGIEYKWNGKLFYEPGESGITFDR